MLFKFEKAIEVRNHYKDIMVGTALTFDEKTPYLKVTDSEAKDFEIYVYHDNGADIFYHELDRNLTEKNIAKIYEVS